MRAGAFDYITKPIDLRHVLAAVQGALKHHQLLQDKRLYENHLEELVRERTAEIEHLAYYDRRTNLPNRALFVAEGEKALQACAANETSGAVLLISIDRFKRITEMLGHDAGDYLITATASRLQECVVAGAMLARFEGDEFAILLCESPQPDVAADVAADIAEVMKPAFSLGEQEVFLTTSIGISHFSQSSRDAAMVLRNASTALDLAKQQGGNNHQFYVEGLGKRARTRFGLEMNLRSAVEANEFVTYYQPIVDLTSGELAGAEALVRWQHPHLGLLSPANFIDLAEDTGLILEIGNQVMKTACAQARRWQQEGFGPLRIAVNVSARQFRADHFPVAW